MILRPLLDSMGVYLGEDSALDTQYIAYTLSHINRYNDRVGVYSVAQHCVEVSKRLPRELQLSGLLHDASEAYLGDIISPVKKLCPQFKKVEKAVLDVIDLHYGVRTRHKHVLEADKCMLVTEAKSFGIWNSAFPSYAGYTTRASPLKIFRRSANESYRMFLRVFELYSS